ncbi:uncharacterized protein LOC143039386 [Oratosquilla oratoria]|uniref:uncharacterized protein LOC143039386 n=1 Tax=Oratosquilla oratoria TaxID=337810 RepID=UPI003F7690E5
MAQRCVEAPGHLGQWIVSPDTGLVSLTEVALKKIINQDPIEKWYSLDAEPIARGRFAVVYHCRHRLSGEEFVAKFSSRIRLGVDCTPDILHEVAVCSALGPTPRTVHLMDVFNNESHVILIFEYAAGGDLQTLLDEDLVPYERDVIGFLRQLLEGLVFLHDHGIVHLDIKPQNLVLMGDFPDCAVKLCDFEIARLVMPGHEVREILGTPDYVAPEIIHYEPITTKTDMWSVGILTYVLLTGFLPFGGDTDQETFLEISKGELDFPDELFEDISEEAIEFIKRLLLRQPSRRLSARECLDHPWMWKEFSQPNPAHENVLTPSPKASATSKTCGTAYTPTASTPSSPDASTTLSLSHPIIISTPSISSSPSHSVITPQSCSLNTTSSSPRSQTPDIGLPPVSPARLNKTSDSLHSSTSSLPHPDSRTGSRLNIDRIRSMSKSREVLSERVQSSNVKKTLSKSRERLFEGLSLARENPAWGLRSFSQSEEALSALTQIQQEGTVYKSCNSVFPSMLQAVEENLSRRLYKSATSIEQIDKVGSPEKLLHSKPDHHNSTYSLDDEEYNNVITRYNTSVSNKKPSPPPEPPVIHFTHHPTPKTTVSTSVPKTPTPPTPTTTTVSVSSTSKPSQTSTSSTSTSTSRRMPSPSPQSHRKLSANSRESPCKKTQRTNDRVNKSTESKTQQPLYQKVPRVSRAERMRREAQKRNKDRKETEREERLDREKQCRRHQVNNTTTNSSPAPPLPLPATPSQRRTKSQSRTSVTDRSSNTNNKSENTKGSSSNKTSISRRRGSVSHVELRLQERQEKRQERLERMEKKEKERRANIASSSHYRRSSLDAHRFQAGKDQDKNRRVPSHRVPLERSRSASPCKRTRSRDETPAAQGRKTSVEAVPTNPPRKSKSADMTAKIERMNLAKLQTSHPVAVTTGASSRPFRDHESRLDIDEAYNSLEEPVDDGIFSRSESMDSTDTMASDQTIIGPIIPGEDVDILESAVHSIRTVEICKRESKSERKSDARRSSETRKTYTRHGPKTITEANSNTNKNNNKSTNPDLKCIREDEEKDGPYIRSLSTSSDIGSMISECSEGDDPTGSRYFQFITNTGGLGGGGASVVYEASAAGDDLSMTYEELRVIRPRPNPEGSGCGSETDPGREAKHVETMEVCGGSLSRAFDMFRLKASAMTAAGRSLQKRRTSCDE